MDSAYIHLVCQIHLRQRNVAELWVIRWADCKLCPGLNTSGSMTVCIQKMSIVSNSVYDKRTKRHVRLSDCVCQGRPSHRERAEAQMLHRNLRGGVILDQPINTRNLVIDYQENHYSYCHQVSHFKAEMHRIRFVASVRLCLRWSLIRKKAAAATRFSELHPMYDATRLQFITTKAGATPLTSRSHFIIRSRVE